MAIKDDELLAAISAGIDNTGAPNEQPDNGGDDSDVGGDDGAASDDVDTAASGEDGAADGSDADGSGDAGDPNEQGSEDADGDDAGAEDEPSGTEEGGKPAKKGDEELGPDGKPLTPEQKREKEERENAEAAKKDPINAPISPWLKPATRERIGKLVEIAKTVTSERDRYMNERNEIIQMVQSTGASAQQYSQALDYLAAVNSRDPEQVKQAIGFLQQEIVALSRIAGVAVDGVNLYENHQDLKTAVDGKQITAQLANEIAAGRDSRSIQSTTRRQTEEQQRAAQEQQVREFNAGKKALNDTGRQLASKDPGYARKAKLVLAQIGDDMKKAPPSQWANMFLMAYTTFKAPAPPARTQQTSKPPVRKPLRGNNPSGGQQGQPKSLEDAINLGIAAGTRR